MKKLVVILFLLGQFLLQAGNFTPGNIVVVRVGTGATGLTNSAQPVFLDEYNRSGTLVQSISLPTSAIGSNHSFSISGIATSEGALRLSTNGQYLMLAGYDAVPGTMLVSTDSTINRVIARIGANGVANTSTGVIAGAAYKADNIRGAASFDGSSFWMAGNGLSDVGGTYYIPFGSFTNSPVKISASPNNTRTVSIFNSQLYVSSQTNAFNGVSTIGTGLPTTSGNTTTLFPGFSSPSSYSIFDFWLFDTDSNVPGMDVLYFVDDRDIPPFGGLYKYSLVNGLWVSNGNVPVAHALKGLVAERTCFTQIFCSSGSRIYSLRDDNGYNQPISGTLTQIALAAANTKFRGIAFAPGTPASPIVQANISSFENVACLGANNGSINISVSGGSAPFIYNWGGGVTSQNRTNLSPGTYTVTVTDASGCTSSVSSAITEPSQLTASTAKTDVNCFGGNSGSITLTVNGGTAPYTFNWGSGVTTQNRINLTSGNYTVTVTDSKGCTISASASITQSSQLTVNAAKTDVNCNGGNNGSVTLSVSGGTPGYTFNWGGGIISQNRSNLSAGNYTVTVTDSKSCTATTSVTITQPASITVSSVKSDVTCSGGNNGSITLTVSGGTPNYTFNWGGGITSQNRMNLVAGTYSVTATDSKGCTAASGVTIAEPEMLVASTTQVDVSCNGGNNGSINLTVAGGTTPYSYNWSNGSTAQNLSGLIAGTYNITVNDSKGCSATAATIVIQPAVLSSSISKTNIACNGGNNGSIDLSVTGGTLAYSYTWSNGATLQDINSLDAGTFNVTVNDANGCTLTTGTTIIQPSVLSTSLTKVNVSCNGGNNGSINLTVSGGTTSYNYNWSNGATTQDLTGLIAGTYHVTVMDANNCTSATNTTISQPAVLNASSTQTNVSCNGGNNGSIDLTVSGGTAPYFYTWSNGATSQDINGLIAGSYNITVNDSKGCSVTYGTIITHPATISSSIIKADISCNGGNNGSIDLSVSGGTMPYTYSWSNGAAMEDINTLGVGTFNVTVHDANGCSLTEGTTITQPSTLTPSLTKVNVSCNGESNGSINLAVSGGTTPYSYSWSNGETTEDITGLHADTYYVTITDANSCTATNDMSITQPSALMASSAQINVGCYGASSGSIDLTVTGGTIPYAYTWSNGATTQDINGLNATSFSVTVIDSKGCSVTMGAIISQPEELSYSIVKESVRCNGGNNGSIDLTVTGGTIPYAYNWSNGATTQDLSNLTIGLYRATITDFLGCEIVAGSVIPQPSAIQITNSTTEASCNGGVNGAISVQVSGGTPSYTFSWSNGATSSDLNGINAGSYVITVTDNHGCTASSIITVGEASALTISLVSQSDLSCHGGDNGAIDISVTGGSLPYTFNWSNGAITEDLVSLGSGNYTVTVSDSNNCSRVENYLINPPAVIGISVTKKDLNCFGGTDAYINLSVNGGVTPYNYTWSNGASSENVSGLTAGSYTVTVADANGCSAASGATVNQPPLLSSFASHTDVGCYGGNDGFINLSVDGGTTPYFYLWSNNSPSKNIDSLQAGNYSVTVTDVKGCTAFAGAAISEPDQLNLSVAQVNVSCNSEDDGSIQLDVTGGSNPYSYLWSNGISAQNISNLESGNYSVTIIDSKGCSMTSGTTITEPDALSSVLSKTNVSCFSGNNGSIIQTINGGTLPYNYTWSNGATTKDINGLIAGAYQVTIYDSMGCTISENTSITQPLLLGISSVQSDVSCNGGNDGAINVNISGGIAPYAYNWSNNTVVQDISNLLAGTYSITATDAQGCSANLDVTVTEPDQLILSANPEHVSCNLSIDGAINIDVSGGTLPYIYDWSNGMETEDITGLGSGVYTITITDNKGCTATSGARIIEPAALTVLTSISDVSCFGLNNGSVNLTVLGGTSPYAYDWSNGTSSENISGVDAGNYAVSITDDNGCIITEGASIVQPSEISISAVVTNLPCSGGNTGAIDLSVTGGTPAYTYAWSNNATTEDIDHLTADAYSVTVTDDNGCSEIFSGAVSQSGTLQVTSSAIDVTCNGFNDGAITITVSGGTPGYSFNWNSGDSSQSATDLPAGIYHVTVSDVNGCRIVTMDTITEPAPLDIFTDVSNITCFGSANGSIGLTVNGGVMPYSYNWSNGSTADAVAGLAAGELSVTVTDDHFCTVTASVSVDEADSISVTADIINVTSLNAHDGSIVLNVSGGTPGYHFEWSNGSNSQEIFNLPGGTFCVLVTDDQSCSVSKCYVVNEPVSVVEKEIMNEFNANFSGESLFIHLRLNTEMECKIQVLDISGKLLAIRNPGKISVLNIEIPGNELSSGMLLVNVVTEKGSLTRKVVAVR